MSKDKQPPSSTQSKISTDQDSEENAKFGELLESLEGEADAEAQSDLIARFAQVSYRGPIPPPIILEQYNNVVPGGAERIMAMAEKQAEHRMNLEKSVIESDVWRSNTGLILGFGAMLFIGLVGLLIATWGQSPMYGAGVITISLASIIGIFVVGKKAQKKELQEKKKSTQPNPDD